MKCENCGEEINSSARFCPACGAKINNIVNALYSPACEVKSESDTVQSKSDTKAPPTSTKNAARMLSPQMGYYKFLIYFALFAGAVINILSAITLFTGSVYGDQDTIEMIYRYYPGMKGVDITSGLLLFCIAAYTFYTRYALANYLKHAPLCLYWLRIINLLYTLLYAAWASSVTGINLFDTKTVSSIGGFLVFLFIEISYFSKRKELFVNDL